MRPAVAVAVALITLGAYTGGIAFLAGQMVETQHAGDYTRGYDIGWHDRQALQDRNAVMLAKMGLCHYATLACGGRK